MNEITRRRFIEAASLAAAAPPFATAQSPAQTQPAAPARASSSRATSRARDLTDAELEAMFRRCSNTGRWGPGDELGTLNCGDCIEKLPYPSESFTSAVHMIVLASMGLPILDWPSLTQLAATCERLKRWDYLLTTAPLRLPGGTASPINPLCVF